MAGFDGILPAPASLDLDGFSFGGIIGGLAAARLGRRVPRLVLLGSGGLGLGHVPPRPLQRIEAAMAPEEIRRVHRDNLCMLMLGSPESADDLAVSLQIENLKRARFKSGTIAVVRRATKSAARDPRAHRRHLGGRDAFTGTRLEECRRVLVSVQEGLDLRVIEPAAYEAPEQVNAALLDLLALPS